LPRRASRTPSADPLPADPSAASAERLADPSAEPRAALELAAVFEALVDPVFVVDATHRVVQANPAAVAALGFDPVGMDRDEVNRRMDYRHPDDRPVAPGEMASARAERGEQVVEQPLAITGADGSRRSVLVSAAEYAREGKRLGVVVTFHDVTERERLLAELREEVELSEALNRVSASIHLSLSFEQIFEAVVRESAEALGATRAAVALPEGDRWVARYLYGAPWGAREIPIPPDEYRYIDEVARSTEPQVIANALSNDAVDPAIARREHVATVASIRLDVRGELIGVLRFTFADRVAFSRPRTDFLKKLAVVVSLGLENARLLAAERHVSETLQSALLAVPSSIRGIACGTMYRSASETARVGGDFYDMFELQGHLIALVIGDVSGKGLEAAAVTALVKNTIRAYAEEDNDPPTVLSKANAVLFASFRPESFVTVFYGVLDITSGELRYCSAGHPHSMLRRRDGKVEPLETRSTFIGAFADAPFVESRSRLDEGDVLLLYTDGVTEARCGDGLLGEDRLAEFIAGLPPTTAGRLPGKIFDLVLDYSCGVLSDDLAMLAVQLER
jgi:PAS domain S-box-containing protein